ncbi:MAG: 30S ribosomal protein S4 [Bacillota bacterium]|nr:30S ribosomal protein S4 [Bacillota bacterium]
MARYTGPVCRLCRRAGEKLFLKGSRCYTDKCPVARRNVPPGQHAMARRKLSDYGVHLREKQKARWIYGSLERQFRNTFARAAKSPGVTGERLLQLLELRLDNVVYRLGLAGSRPEARQLVRHGHFQVNGRKVDIPSYQVREGDRIEVREKSRKLAKFQALKESPVGPAVPDWLSADLENLGGTVLRLPRREEIDSSLQEQLIVEYYSR